jgi:phage gp36-like protein
LLKRLVCALAMTYLRRRRAYEEDEWPEYTEALEILERLGEGALVFGSVQAVIDAGNPVVDVLNATIQSSQGIVSSIASQRFLPSRNYPQ